MSVISWYEQITITTTLLLGALSSPTMASLCTMPASTGTSFLLSSLASLSMVSSKFLSQRLQIGIIGIFAFFLCVRSVCSDYNCSLCWAGTTSFSKVALSAIFWNYWKKIWKNISGAQVKRLLQSLQLLMAPAGQLTFLHSLASSLTGVRSWPSSSILPLSQRWSSDWSTVGGGPRWGWKVEPYLLHARHLWRLQSPLPFQVKKGRWMTIDSVCHV